MQYKNSVPEMQTLNIHNQLLHKETFRFFFFFFKFFYTVFFLLMEDPPPPDISYHRAVEVDLW